MGLVRTIEKLHAFRKLEDGWRFGYGGAPAQDLILKAEKSLRTAFAFGVDTADVFTGSNREVVVALYNPSHDLEIIFESNGSVTVVEDVNDEQIEFVENVSDVELFRRIWEFQFSQSNLFAPSIRDTFQSPR